MSELGLTPDEAISTISQTYVENYIQVAALALIIYDAILTISQEWHCIWQRKFTSATLLYVLIRYGTVLDMSLQTFQEFWMPTTASSTFYDSCEAVAILEYITHLLVYFGIAVFNCLRIWAISQRQWYPAISVFLFSMFVPCITLYNLSRPQTWNIVSSGPLKGCWDISVNVYQYLPIITRAISIGADLLVLAFTLLETVNTFRISQAQHIRTTLITLLIYNGVLQFITFVILNTIAVILDTVSVAIVTEASSASGFILINDCIISIILSRFLLDLRSISDSDNSSSGQYSSSIDFVSSIIGNMGATVSAPWAVEEGEDRDVEED